MHVCMETSLQIRHVPECENQCERHTCSGLILVSTLVSRLSGPGSSPGRGHCVVFLGKTLYSHSASLHSGV